MKRALRLAALAGSIALTSWLAPVTADACHITFYSCEGLDGQTCTTPRARVACETATVCVFGTCVCSLSGTWICQW